MSEKVIGLDVLLQINTGTPESPTYTTIGGQQDASINPATDPIDVSSKDGEGWKEYKGGFKGWDGDWENIVKESDQGINAAIAAFFSKQPILVKILFPGGMRMTGSALIIAIPMKSPMGGASTYSFKVQGTGPLLPVTTTVTTPSVTAPADEATSVSVTPACTSSEFAVTGGSDTHAATQWQITTAADTGFASPVYDSESTVDLEAVTIQASKLTAETSYLIRVRHKGLNSGWSAWSAANEFETAA